SMGPVKKLGATGEEAFSGRWVEGNRIEILHDGRQCFPVMLRLIEAAKTEICLEMYWFGSDRTGRRFADALMARAREGVLVRVIYDAVGSWDTDGGLFDDLRRAGCEVLEFNPIAPWRRGPKAMEISRRDHRKILVVDGRVGMTGGVNLGDPWAPEEEGGAGWRDDMMLVEGPAAKDLRDVFFHTWTRKESWDHSLGEGGAAVEDAVSFGTIGEDPEALDAPVLVLANHYRGERRAIRGNYLRAIRHASRSIEITNSYFVPDSRIRRELMDAVRRGVRVRVMVPGQSDVPAVQRASQYLYGRMLRAGIRIFEWNRSVLHAKTAIVDDAWCTVGTYNLDYLSWRSNLEVTMGVRDADVCRAMRTRFDRDLESCREILASEWSKRPLLPRVAERFWFTFRKVL
ncbi:MAG: cardiolipin synthase B, partial [Myxococcales bacterium]|nr:cardiolipin synthase B [Myxococcales bacterium]